MVKKSYRNSVTLELERNIKMKPINTKLFIKFTDNIKATDSFNVAFIIFDYIPNMASKICANS